MLFMVIERYKNRDAKAIYERFQDAGRQMPDGMTYIDSWVEANFDRCFVLIECDDSALLQDWVLAWRDLVEFEFVPVAGSKDTAAGVLSKFN